MSKKIRLEVLYKGILELPDMATGKDLDKNMMDALVVKSQTPSRSAKMSLPLKDGRCAI